MYTSRLSGRLFTKSRRMRPSFVSPTIAGTEDALLPRDVLDQYRGIYGDRLELHVFEGLDHTFETVPGRARLLEVTTEFLLRTT